jgi:N-acetylmuramoyl-L-alanine amidase
MGILGIWIVALVTILPNSHASQKPKAAFRSGNKFLVVLDPGHGGNDSGAHIKESGQNFTEKDLTLKLARDLARELIIRDFNVILTRNQDEFVPLADRTALANKVKADVFVSIHLNSTSEKMKRGGVETFILNHATDEASKRLADLENSVLKDSAASEKNSTPDISLIMKDMILDANLEPSRKLACAVHDQLKKGTKDRGVKQALFYVLLGADMPSILIEAGFINASEDRERILDQKSRLKLANHFAQALEAYRRGRVPNCKIHHEDQFQRSH